MDTLQDVCEKKYSADTLKDFFFFCCNWKTRWCYGSEITFTGEWIWLKYRFN